MAMVTLYTTNCPKCMVLETKLKEKNVLFETCGDITEMRKLGLLSAPALKVDDKLMTFKEAVDWVNSL